MRTLSINEMNCVTGAGYFISPEIGCQFDNAFYLGCGYIVGSAGALLGAVSSFRYFGLDQTMPVETILFTVAGAIMGANVALAIYNTYVGPFQDCSKI